jgi:D-lactate dehydrogenase (cytochrome)
MLLVEFHGTPRGVEEQAERFGEIAADLGGGPFTWATRAEDRSRLWQARHDAYWAALDLRPGSKVVATDVCVPISRLADCVTQTQVDIRETGLTAPILGHVGDGNFHVSILVDMNDPAEVGRVEGFIERLVRRGLAMEGTCTGEHGIGQLKRKYMREEHAPEALALMQMIKTSLDPQGMMNPGKIL